MKFNHLILAVALAAFAVPATYGMDEAPAAATSTNDAPTPRMRMHEKAFEAEEAHRPAKKRRTDFTNNDCTNCSKSRKRNPQNFFEGFPEEEQQLPKAKRTRGRSRTRKIVAESTPEPANASPNPFLSQLHNEHERRRIELKSRRDLEEFIEKDAAEVQEINARQETIAFNAELKQMHEESKQKKETAQEEELCKMLENIHLNTEKPE